MRRFTKREGMIVCLPGVGRVEGVLEGDRWARYCPRLLVELTEEAVEALPTPAPVPEAVEVPPVPVPNEDYDEGYIANKPPRRRPRRKIKDQVEAEKKPE